MRTSTNRLSGGVQGGFSIKRKYEPLTAHSENPQPFILKSSLPPDAKMREIVHLQAGQCGNQIGAKVSKTVFAI